MKKFVKIFKLCFQLILASYFIGSYWYIFCKLYELRTESSDSEYSFDKRSFVINFPDKAVLPNSTEIIIASMYFVMTTLSTVGLGDYHPENDVECVVCCFILILGVMTFSYILGKIQNMMALETDCQFEDDYKLT